MANEEILMQLSMLEQQSQELTQQVESANNQISEIEALKLSMEKLKSGKYKEVLSPLGRGVFIKTNVKDDKVFVNVGNKVVIKKSYDEAIKLLDAQIIRVKEIKESFVSDIEEINKKLQNLILEAEKAR